MNVLKPEVNHLRNDGIKSLIELKNIKKSGMKKCGECGRYYKFI